MQWVVYKLMTFGVIVDMRWLIEYGIFWSGFKILVKRDYICLQSLKMATKYACNVGNRHKVTWLWFLDESLGFKFLLIASIYDRYWKRSQAYMVRYGFEIAGIFYSVISQKTGAVKPFEFDTLFSELIIMRNIKSYFGFKWLLSQVWDKKLLEITKKI